MEGKSSGADRPHRYPSSSSAKVSYGAETKPPIVVFEEKSSGELENRFPRIIGFANRKGASVSLVSEAKGKKNYWKQVNECDKVFGKSVVAPEKRDARLKQDLWRNNFYRGFGNSNPFQRQIEDWTPDRGIFLGLDCPNPIPINVNSTVKFVDTIKELREIVQSCSNSEISTLTLDLEFHNRDVYGKSITSTLQLSYHETNVVIDCLNGNARQGVRHGIHKVLEDEQILKIGCGVTEDVKALQKDFGIYVHPIVDIQVVFHVWLKLQGKQCIICCQSPCKESNECLHASMKKIVQYFYPSLEISKLPQNADWSQRPLPDELIVYASLDTSVLLKIWNFMKTSFGLSERNLELFRKEVVPSCRNIALSRYDWNKDNENNIKWMKKQGLFGKDQRIMENIFIARDWICRKDNRDPDRFLTRDKCLTLMQASSSQTQDEFKKSLQNVLPGSSEEFYSAFLDVMNGVELKPPAEMVVNPGIECSRCHQHSHTMGQCALPRVRNDDDKKKNVARYRKKRAQNMYAGNYN